MMVKYSKAKIAEIEKTKGKLRAHLRSLEQFETENIYWGE